jgi:hypothetical protein
MENIFLTFFAKISVSKSASLHILERGEGLATLETNGNRSLFSGFAGQPSFVMFSGRITDILVSFICPIHDGSLLGLWYAMVAG